MGEVNENAEGDGGEPESELSGVNVGSVHNGNTTVVELYACRALLCCRSGYFRGMVGPEAVWRETAAAAQGHPITTELPATMLRPVLEFIHTGCWRPSPIAIELAVGRRGKRSNTEGERQTAEAVPKELELALAVAEYFDLHGLREACVDWVVEALSADRCCALWNLATSHTSLGGGAAHSGSDAGLLTQGGRGGRPAPLAS